MQNQDFDKTKALTFSSIMSAISIVLILITFFSGDIGLFLMLILPLCASLVAVKVNFKYSLIYFLSTFLIYIEKYYVIFSLPECMSCLTLNEYLEKSFSHLDLIYLIDISSQEYKNNLMQKDNVGVSSFTDIQINKAPTLLLIKSKVVISQIEGLELIHSYLETQF